MARKKQSKEELMNQAALTTLEALTPTNTFIPVAVTREQAEQFMDETTAPDKKKLRSFYCSESTFEALSDLARFRSMMGEKNSKGQAIGAGTLIDEAAAEYVERHRAELEKWREIFASITPPEEYKKKS